MEELLQKAQVYSLSLKEIGERIKEPLSDETLPEWKVEMAVDAAAGFLKEILISVDSTLSIERPEGISLSGIARLSYLRPLIPVALGIALRGGDLSAEIKELKRAAEEWEGRKRERARRVEEFLSAFRQLARSVVERGQDAVSGEAVNSLVEQYFSDIIPSEPLRSHIAVVLADILRLIAVPREEVDRAITEGVKSLSRFYRNTLFDYQVLRDFGFEDDEQIRLAHDYLAPAAMLQYYVNRFAAGRAHNIFLQLVPSLDQIPDNLNSYFPLLPWATLYPAQRERVPLQALSGRSPYEFLTTRGLVTSIGANVLSVNMGPGYRLATEIADLMGLKERVPAWVSEAHTRRFPDVMLGFLKTLAGVLGFLRDHWEEIGGEIDPGKVPVLAAFINRLGLAGKDSDTVRSVIDDKLAALANIADVYKDPSVLVERIPDYIMSLSEAVDWALGTSEREILSNINKLIVELGVHFISDTGERLKLMQPYAYQALWGPAGARLSPRFGLTWRLPEGRKKRRVSTEDLVEGLVTDITNYMVNGPSAGESYRDWFEKVKGGIELILRGNAAEGAGADYWRQRYQEYSEDPIDWDGVARARKDAGLYLGMKPQNWLNLLQQAEGRIRQASSEEEVEQILRGIHDILRGVVSSSWESLADNIVSSTFGRIRNLQAQYPEFLAQYLRSAMAAARRRVETVSLEQPISGEEGRTFEETIGVEMRGVTEKAEEMAESIVNHLAFLVSEALRRGEAQTLREAFSTPKVQQFFSALAEVLKEDDVLLQSVDAVLNEIEGGVRPIELPKGVDIDEFLSLVDDAIDQILAEVPSEPEEPQEEERETEAEVEEKEGETVFMKFYLLSKVLPVYSS
jgi:hypothetical protein